MTIAHHDLVELLLEAAADAMGPRETAVHLIEQGVRPAARVITTAEELEALPERSVVLDRDGDAFQRRGGLWCSYETSRLGSRKLAKFRPITVLWTPGGSE